MAVKKCKECGNQVSTKAKACPSCGAKAPKKTSLLTWAVALVICLAIYTGSQNSDKPVRLAASPTATSEETAIIMQEEKPAAATSELQKQREKVQRLFRDKAEPTAKDALWTSDDILKVGVIDDGTPRDGYASYACQVLYEHGFRGHGVWVQVIDIVELTRNDDWVKLGEARCE